MRTFTITVQGDDVFVFRAEGASCSFGGSTSLAVALSAIPRGREERLGIITESIVMVRRHCFTLDDIAEAVAKGHGIADDEDAQVREGEASDE